MGTTVLIELIVAVSLSGDALAAEVDRRYPALHVDPSYEPVPMEPPPEVAQRVGPNQRVVLIRCTLDDPAKRDELEQDPLVVNIWTDAPIAPFDE